MSGDRKPRRALPPARRVESELEHHLQERTERLIEQGWDPGTARAEAERRFGDLGRWTDELRQPPAREGLRRTVRVVGAHVARDVRHALRQIRRHPFFSAVTVLTLGAGIGVNTAIFSAAKQVVRPDLPFAEPDRLARLYQIPEGSGLRISPRIPVFMAVRDGASAFSSVAGSRFTDLTIETPEGPERAIGNAITPGWLETVGVQPALGRSFSAEEEAQGESSPVVLIGHGTWQQRFGGAEDVLGRQIRMNGTLRTVVGVLPPGFNHPYNAEFWFPLSPESDQGGFWALNLKARLRPGATLAQATEELDALSRAMEGVTPGLNPGTTITPIGIREALVGDEGRTLSALMVAVGFLLLIVCANVANLLVSRSVGRRPEFALRASLGASRGRLVQQSVAESLVLGLLGGLLGILVGAIGLRAVAVMMPENLTLLGVEPRLDGAVLSLSLAAGLGTGLLVGLLPGIGVSRGAAAAALSAGARGQVGRGERRLGRALATGELAVTLILVTAVGLLVRDFQQRQGLDLGYDPENAVVFTVSLDGDRYASMDARTAFVDGLLAELEASPGSVAAAATNMFPRHQGNSVAQLEREGAPVRDAEGLSVNHRLVTPGYLETMGASLTAGRHLAPTDVAGGPPVAVISERLARQLWQDEDPVGSRLRNARAGDDAEWITVVGVVADILEADDIAGTWYLPWVQHAEGSEAGQLTVVTRGAPAQGPPTARSIRDAVARVDNGLPIYDAMTARAANDRNLSSARQGVWVGTVFGLFGLLLAALGIYGTIAYFVSRRVREFGVRRALGSGPTGIVSIVATEIATLVGIGGLIGLVGAAAAGRVLSAFLVEVGAFDAAAFAGALAVVVAVALLAGLIPAARATRIDPIEALRAE